MDSMDPKRWLKDVVEVEITYNGLEYLT